MEYCIYTSSLVKKFGEFNAINDLNLKVKKGEICGLLGPNGAGKTTTINIFPNFLVDRSNSNVVKTVIIPSFNLCNRC